MASGFKVGRITKKRRDGKDIKYENWKGEKMRGPRAPVGTIFGRRHEGRIMLSVAMDEDTDKEYFFDLYLDDEFKIVGGQDDSEGDDEPKPRRKPGKGKPSKVSEPEDDGDEEDPFDSDED